MCDDCKNYEPKVEEKEEWEDCTKEWDFKCQSGELIAQHKNTRNIMSIVPRILYGLDSPTFDGGYRVIDRPFRIERRVVKKVCKECGKEL